ncbi:hypothetical protein JXM67_13865 [candidate division WOR-3 bacterium]|nr:hypothetical protein [candidate division WOR-3 bacterium]
MNCRTSGRIKGRTLLSLTLVGLTVSLPALPLTAEDSNEPQIPEIPTDSIESDTPLSDSLTIDTLFEDTALLDTVITDTTTEDTTMTILTLLDTIGIIQVALKQEFWPKNVVSTVILSDTNVRYAWLPEIEGIHFIIMDAEKLGEKARRTGDFMYHRIGEIEQRDTATVLTIHYEWEPPHSNDKEYMEAWVVKEKGKWRAERVYRYREAKK